MERVIKFRDYELVEKVMRYFTLDTYDREEHDCFGNIMQFTGLLDINGKEIYEGDYIKYKISNQLLDNSEKDIIEVVKWENVGWNLNIYKQYEIIGNIHENPDFYILDCMECGTHYIGEEPQMCCSGRDCGCMGMPIDPIMCSEECYNNFCNKPKKSKTIPISRFSGISSSEILEDNDEADYIQEIKNGTHKQFELKNGVVHCKCGHKGIYFKTGYLCGTITAYPCKYN